MSTQPPNTDYFNRFPTLLIISDKTSRRIEYASAFSMTMLSYPNKELTFKKTCDLLSNGSTIFFESYIEPLLKEYGECHEVQITLLTKDKQRIPCVANISELDQKFYWSIQSSVKRDKLYQELINTRDSLEEKTEKLRLAARTDLLTQLLNRRAAFQDINKMMAQIQRNYVPLAFLLIDIDFFKKINDTYGHDAGDEILKQLAKVLQTACRKSDIVARWGGEEFLIVLYNSDMIQTQRFCERLHEKIPKVSIEHQSITISIGATQSDSAENLIDEIIKQADIALYQAKENGRNCTKFFSAKNP